MLNIMPKLARFCTGLVHELTIGAADVCTALTRLLSAACIQYTVHLYVTVVGM